MVVIENAGNLEGAFEFLLVQPLQQPASLRRGTDDGYPLSGKAGLLQFRDDPALHMAAKVEGKKG